MTGGDRAFSNVLTDAMIDLPGQYFKLPCTNDQRQARHRPCQSGPQPPLPFAFTLRLSTARI